MLKKIGAVIKWVAWLVAAIAASLSYFNDNPTPPLPVSVNHPIVNTGGK